MSDRDRQNPYDRNQQYGSGQRGGDYDSPSQANQWQSDSYRQQGGDWQQDAGHRNDDDQSRGSRYSSQGGSQGYGSQNYGDRSNAGSSYGRGSQDYDRGGSQAYNRNAGQSYRSQLNDDDLRSDQREASRNYGQARGGYAQGNYRNQDRNWQQGSSQGQRGSTSGYSSHDYDASGGNDFGNFTSEDFGGRDFYNRGGGASGGMRSSESYRPSYGLSSWTRGHDDNDGRLGRNEQSRHGGREDYGSWRQYGESRGFLAKAGDEIASWFGDEDASRRRDQDRREDDHDNRAQGQGNYQSHRGRGPSDYTRSDDRIREDANDHLTHDHEVDATHITVSVKDGELTLNGTVESRQAKRRAEDCVEHISGVKHVQNNLRVQERSSSTSSYGSSGGSSTGTTYGSSAGQSSSLSGQGSASSLSGATGSGGTGSGTGGSTTGGSTATSATGAAGSSTTATGTGGSASTGGTSGIGSATPASTSATTRQGEKTT